MLPSALQAARVGHDLIVPMANGREAALAQGTRVFVAPHLRDVCRHAAGQQALALEAAVVSPTLGADSRGPDLVDVRGQAGARRALEIAAAGEHSLLKLWSIRPKP